MLISLTIREMKIKTKMRYYLTRPPIAIIKKKKKKVTQKNKSWQIYGETRTFIYFGGN